MRFRVLAFVLAPALTLGDLPPTLAQPSTMDECLAKDTQGEMHRCAHDAVRAQRARLDAAVLRYTNRLDPKQRKVFNNAHRAWAAFEKRECDFRSLGVEGGSMQPTVNLLCLSHFIEQRLAQLDYLENCEEGDLSCPAPRNRE